MITLKKPNIKQSISNKTFQKSPITPKLLKKSNSKFNTLFSYNSTNTQKQQKTFKKNPIQKIQSTQNPKKFPIYNKKKIKQNLNKINLLLPKIYISSPKKPSTIQPSTNIKPTKTPTYYNYYNLYNNPKSQLKNPNPFKLKHPNLFLQKQPKISHHYTYYQTNNKKKLIQYTHNNIIKTFN